MIANVSTRSTSNIGTMMQYTRIWMPSKIIDHSATNCHSYYCTSRNHGTEYSL